MNRTTSKSEFNSFTAMMAAAKACGFRTRIDPPSHEGMHEDDCFKPVYFVDEQGNDVGQGGNTQDAEDAPLEFYGILFDTAAEYDDWVRQSHEDDDAFMAAMLGGTYHVTMADGDDDEEAAARAKGGWQSREVDNEPQDRADTPEAFEALVRHMGFDDTADFEATTGIEAVDLIGKWFSLLDNRVYSYDDDEDTATDDETMAAAVLAGTYHLPKTGGAL
jgi:hypothetical protein